MATNITITTSAEPTNYTLSTGARGPRGLPGGGAVTSVAGRTGDVTLVSEDISDANAGGAGVANAGKVPLFGGAGQLTAPYFHAQGETEYPNVKYTADGITIGEEFASPRTLSWPSASGTLMLGSNNLSDLTNATVARTALGLGTTDSPTFAGANIGNGAFTNTGVNLQLRVNGYNYRFESTFFQTTTIGCGGNIIIQGNGSYLAFRNGDFRIYHDNTNYRFGTTSDNAGGSISLTNLTASGTVTAADLVISTAYTSGTTPAHAAGKIIRVSDGSSSTPGNTYSGGGAEAALVASNGSAWKYITPAL